MTKYTLRPNWKKKTWSYHYLNSFLEESWMLRHLYWRLTYYYSGLYEAHRMSLKSPGAPEPAIFLIHIGTFLQFYILAITKFDITRMLQYYVTISVKYKCQNPAHAELSDSQ
jgi:hypothetical protein